MSANDLVVQRLDELHRFLRRSEDWRMIAEPNGFQFRDTEFWLETQYVYGEARVVLWQGHGRARRGVYEIVELGLHADDRTLVERLDQSLRARGIA